MSGFTTRAIHAIENVENEAIVPPIYLASTFGQPTTFEEGPFEYQRGGNPTRANVETTLAKIEGAAHARVFASGMGATAAVMGMLKTGETMLLGMPVYGGNYRFATIELPKRGIETRFIHDFSTLTDADFEGNVKMVFLETPTNPTLRVADIARIAEIAHRNGALLVVDNTFMTPYLQLPLELGADVVVQSATKYLAGHGDLLGGVVTTNSVDIDEQVFKAQLISGGILPPMDSYRLMQNVKTLAIRMERQQENTLAILEMLREHPAVEDIFYAGSASESEAEIHNRQAKGIGALFSFTLVEGKDIKTFLDNLKVFTFAVSLGGIESLICLPATMTQGAYAPEHLADSQVGNNLLRVAVGIEDLDDLLTDLRTALDAA
ncbi:MULTISPECIES: PLP-dependent aspartate aminotransferase family protein [unclassified Rothia (in: high G+C Gram-positive bacteria)]|uniref:trans-sulfuration enzyme family protein n=1 Tax=unclassified Rothia (in: high G+C Gram-positive bacteria) TaxID=2689056 RepID=UPI00195B5E9A|nr:MULTISPECIES: PLP-dependent aspartate aminotransferase family protein [unclassified Rothia (in: high G+C Gram-positive bacteria)]MBM7052146.1 PLP-dependent transferase [Rothia sp. ZJ1223]QRZ61421.1 PLP-dependent transferase [Rothia sp. ZJ932]